MIDVKIFTKAKGSSASTGGKAYSIQGIEANINDIKSTLTTQANFNAGITNLLIPVDKDGNELSWAEAAMSDGEGGIRAKSLKTHVGLWSEQWISTRGRAQYGGGSGQGATLLGMLEDVTLESLLDGQALVYDALTGMWVNRAFSQGLNTTELAQYLITNNYAKKSDIPSLAGYATQSWVLGKGYALASDLTAHTGDTALHITAAERILWNNTANSLTSILGADSDTIINKWDEVVAFLATYTEADTLAGLLSNKVDKVAGKGLSANDFTDALLGKLKGIEAGANKYIHPTVGANAAIAAAAGKVLSTITVDGMGHVTAVGSKTLDTSDIPALAISKITGLQSALDSKLDAATFNDMFELVTIDGVVSIRAKHGLWSEEFISTRGTADGSGGTGGGGIDEEFLAQWLVDNGYAKKTDIPSLTGYATQSWVNSQGFLKSITKSQVESVLTGNITSHTHQYIVSSGRAAAVTDKSSIVAGISMVEAYVNGYPCSYGNVIRVKGIRSSGSGELLLGWAGVNNALERIYYRNNRDAVTTFSEWRTLAFITDIPTKVSQLTNDSEYLTSHQSLDYINVKDIRGTTPAPNEVLAHKVTAWFNNSSKPDASDWYSGLTVRGWNGDYCVWQIAANANNAYSDYNPYFRVGLGTSWGTWQTILTSNNCAGILNGKYVTLDTAQTITGAKAFTATNNNFAQRIEIRGAKTSYETFPNLLFHIPNVCYARLQINNNGDMFLVDGSDSDWTKFKNFKAAAFIKSGGTSSQFLKADGSADGNSYVPWSKASLATVNGTNSNPQFFNIENETLIANYGAFWSVINLGSYSQSNYRSQIAFPYVNSIADTDMFIRTANSNVWRAWRRVLHDGNYTSILDGRYVNAAGDTMTGALSFNKADTLISAKYNADGSYTNVLWANPTINTVIYGSPAWANVVLETSAAGVYRQTSNTKYKIWDSGNDGSGSGLDADLLDGHQESVFFRQSRGQIPTAYIDITDYNIGASAYANYAPGTYQIARSGSSELLVNLALNAGSTSALQFRTSYSNETNLYFRKTIDSNRVSGAWTTILTNLNIGSYNAGSATKWANARTFWGQSTDGSNNVSGNMTGVGSITASGSNEITAGTDASPHFSVNNGTYKLGLLIGNAGINRGIYDYTNAGWVLYRDDTLNVIIPSGNVGIGTTSPACKLDVNGSLSATTMRTYGFEVYGATPYIDFHFNGSNADYTSRIIENVSGELYISGKLKVGTPTNNYALNAASFICDSWVRTKGSTGWYNETHGGGFYMQDTVWIRTHNQKSIYTGSGTIRTDGQIQVGAEGSKFKVDANGAGMFAGDLTLGSKLNFTSPLGTGYLQYIKAGTSDSSGIWWDDANANSTSHSTNLEIYSHWGVAFKFWGDGMPTSGKIAVGIDTRVGDLQARGDIRSWTKLSVRFGELKFDDAASAIYTDSGFYSTKFISTKGTADTSDMRLKRVVGTVDLTLEQIAGAPLFTFEWRDGAVEGEYLGTSAQYWERILPQSVMRLGKYRAMFYGQTALASAIANSRKLLAVESSHRRWLEKHETRLQRLERENRELRKEIEELKLKTA